MLRMVFAAAFLFLPSCAFADDAKCDLRDTKSVCTVHLTVAELTALNAALEEAPVPHKNWGAAWSDVEQQVVAQQPAHK